MVGDKKNKLSKKEKLLEVYRKVNKFAADNAVAFVLGATLVFTMNTKEAVAQDIAGKREYLKDCIILDMAIEKLSLEDLKTSSDMSALILGDGSYQPNEALEMQIGEKLVSCTQASAYLKKQNVTYNIDDIIIAAMGKITEDGRKYATNLAIASIDPMEEKETTDLQKVATKNLRNIAMVNNAIINNVLNKYFVEQGCSSEKKLQKYAS